jgi:hypothetical protein
VPHARGGGVADGWFTVGERGFELGYKRGSQVSIFDNARSRQMLGGVNPRGYANGTGDRITTGTLGGRKIWIYGGTDYGSLLGATNAYNRDHNKKNKDVYSVDGKKYTTLIGAENHAQTLMAAKIRLDVKVDTKDLPRFSRAIKGTVDQARAAFGFLFNDARTAGVSSHLLKHLKAEDHQLNLEIGKRNAIADKLKAVRDKMSSLASSVRSGVSGVFDVTSAGANPVTGYITGGSLFAQQAQALTQIRKFSSAIRKLEHRHLNKAYLMQLASQGPSVLPQLEALLSMPARQFSQFNAQAGAISAAGAALGTNVANSVYGNQAAALARQEKAENRRAEKLAHTIAHELAKAVDKETSRPIDVKVNGKTLLEITRKAVKESAR